MSGYSPLALATSAARCGPPASDKNTARCEGLIAGATLRAADPRKIALNWIPVPAKRAGGNPAAARLAITRGIPLAGVPTTRASSEVRAKRQTSTSLPLRGEDVPGRPSRSTVMPYRPPGLLTASLSARRRTSTAMI